MAKISNPHDKYFRTAMSNKRVAKDFLKHHLPEYILDKVNLDSIALKKESFVDQHLKMLISDMLYTVEFNQELGYIYILVEHQSKSDRLMPLRILRYMCRIMAHHIEQLNHKELPIIYPLVFYHGQSPYRHSTDIFQLFNEKQQALARAVLFKPFQLVDVTQVPDQELQQHESASMMELIQKHIFARDFLNHLESIIPAIQFIDQHGDKPYLDTSLHYLLHRGNVEDINRFLEIIHDKIPAELEGDVMTIAELLIAKGHKEGLKKGQHLGLRQGALNANKAIALKMHQAGIDMETIEKITNIDVAELI